MVKEKKLYLVARPIFRGARGFCHRTTLISATSVNDAIAAVHHLHPHDNIGDVKLADYLDADYLDAVKEKGNEEMNKQKKRLLT